MHYFYAKFQIGFSSLIQRFFNTSYQNVKSFIKKSSTRRNGEQFTIGMLKSAVTYC
ncbi:hypothetical protein HMPREF9554_01857 [Treponema phagedenis F0421]|nr:hypothetical protein HMPREF9554_01857 [Treponema phagedenis F0421]